MGKLQTEYTARVSYEYLLMKWIDQLHHLYVEAFLKLNRVERVANLLAFVEGIIAFYEKLTPKLQEDVKQELAADPEELLRYSATTTYDKNGRVKEIIIRIPDQQTTGDARRDSDVALQTIVKKARRVASAIISVLDANGLLLRTRQEFAGWG